MSFAVLGRLTSMRLRAVIEGNGKTAAGIEVPPAVVEKLGAGRRPAVRVTIGDHTYPRTVGTMGGCLPRCSPVVWLPVTAPGSCSPTSIWSSLPAMSSDWSG